MALTAPPGFPPSSKVGLIQRRHWSRLFLRVNPVAKFIVPDGGYKVDFGIRLSYRHARIHRLGSCPHAFQNRIKIKYEKFSQPLSPAGPAPPHIKWCGSGPPHVSLCGSWFWTLLPLKIDSDFTYFSSAEGLRPYRPVSSWSPSHRLLPQAPSWSRWACSLLSGTFLRYLRKWFSESVTMYLCRWLQLAQLAKGKKSRP